jgi:hypothetical protein
MTWQTKLIAILLVFTSLFVWHKYQVHRAVSNTIAEQTAIYKKQVDELTIKSLKIESELKNQVLVIKGEKDAQIKNLDTKYRVAINGLRQRQERDSTTDSTRNSCNAESTKGATGAELFREDAEFLIGFARDTEELKTQLKACYAQYDSIYDQLKNYKSK